MPNSRRLTTEEIDQRIKFLEAAREKRFNDPKRVEAREWVKNAFKSDLNAICDYAASLMLDSSALAEENQELVDTINRIHRNAHYLAETTKMDGYIKRNVATMTLKHQPDDPASLAFMSGMSVSRQLRATAAAGKRHAENHSMRADVFLWLDANMSNFRSMDSAAESIFGKVAPISFRTARDWVGQWKKLRSASTP